MTNVRTKPPRPLALFVSTHSEIIFCSTVMRGLLGGQEELRKRRIVHQHHQYTNTTIPFSSPNLR